MPVQKKSQTPINPVYGVLTLFLLILTVFVIFLIRNENKKYYYIGKTETRDTITINGEGMVTAIPDIAEISFGITKEDADVAKAQQQVNENMNSFIDELKKMSVEAEDITTTGYRINPVYDYNNGKQVLRGYRVEQNIEVKIRNLDKIGDTLNLAVAQGLNQVSGLEFTIDDPESLKQEAREIALENAKEKAESLADIADVKLGKIVTFSESESTPSTYASYDLLRSDGLGGAAEYEAPSIEAGSTEVTINVTVSYEIL